MKTEIEVSEQIEVNIEEDKTVDLYGYGNESHKTWYITKAKKDFMPKGSRLLILIKGTPTNQPVYVSGTYPQEGHVIQTIDSERYLVKSVQWI